MKAMCAERLAGIDALKLAEVPDPKAGPGELLIRMSVCTVNIADLAAVRGEMLPAPQVPHIPGIEGSGIVLGAGEGVTGFKPGDPVAAFFSRGALAEKAVTRADRAVKLPAKADSAAAATLPHAYAGALYALHLKARLKKDEYLLVLGAGGTQGIAAIEVGKLMGARVIAAAPKEDRKSIAEEHGADVTIASGETPLVEAVAEVTKKRGADVVFDPVGGDGTEAAVRALASRARYVAAGFMSGKVPNVPVRALFARDADYYTANSYAIAEANHEQMRDALAQIMTWYGEGRLRPRVAAKFPLAEAQHAFSYVLSRRGAGATLVTIHP